MTVAPPAPVGSEIPPGIKTFLHSGDLGDVIYALPAMKWLGGGIMFLTTRGYTKVFTPERVALITPLLKAQPYVVDVRWHNGERIDYNFADFRAQYNRRRNLAAMQALYVGADQNCWKERWLEVGEPIKKQRVIVHRSPRYHNNSFPWPAVLDYFKGDIMYCGVPHEHAEFETRFGKIDFHHPADFLELAQIIEGSDLFIGNQSSPYSVAEGLKHDSIQETCPGVQDCVFPRPNAELVSGSSVNLQRVERFSPGNGTLQMETAYFTTQNATRPIKIGSQFKNWQRTKQVAGSWRGCYATNNLEEINILRSIGGGVAEVGKPEFVSMGGI